VNASRDSTASDAQAPVSPPGLPSRSLFFITSGIRWRPWRIATWRKLLRQTWWFRSGTGEGC